MGEMISDLILLKSDNVRSCVTVSPKFVKVNMPQTD
jgi:hypothetical protein